jgi:ribosomal protein L37AE/L43A
MKWGQTQFPAFITISRHISFRGETKTGSEVNPTVCPKCGYARKPADTAPAWMCPSCGIAYNKFASATATQAAGLPAAVPDLRQTRLATGQRDKPGSTAFLFYGAALSILGVVVFYTPLPPLTSLKWALPVFVVSSFLFWLSAFQRKRAFEDVPTSTVAAAAQGYIELRGTAEAAPGHSLRGRLTGAPCIWCQFVMKERNNEGEYVETEAGSLGVPFLLRDKTGECLVDAGQAEVVCNRCQQWKEDGRTCEEWSIRVGDPIYVVGFFSTGNADAVGHLNMKVAYQLASEQRNPAAFAARYDTDHDGKVDAREVAVARVAKRREEEQRLAHQGGVHTVGPSPDGRPFLVVSAGQERVSTHYALLAAVHLGVFFISLGALAFLLL